MKLRNVINYMRHLRAYACYTLMKSVKGFRGVKRVKVNKYANNPLHVPKYGGEGVVHPDILYFPHGFDGFKFWLFYTPFPPESLENPCLVRSNNGVDFTDFLVSNPLISAGGSGEWDDGHLADVDVVKVGDTWYLFYASRNACRTYQKIGLATSTDGKKFTKYSQNPVLEADTSLSFEAGDHLVSPTVIHSGAKFFMWYFSKGDDGKWRMCLAESVDGKNWAKYEGNPVLEPTSRPCSWDKERIWHGDVIYYLDEYWLYYSGSDGHFFRLGLARSNNGIDWEKYEGNPILDRIRGTWEGALYRPSSIVINGKLWLYYSAFETYWHNPRIGLAWSEVPSKAF